MVPSVLYGIQIEKGGASSRLNAEILVSGKIIMNVKDYQEGILDEKIPILRSIFSFGDNIPIDYRIPFLTDRVLRKSNLQVSGI